MFNSGDTDGANVDNKPIILRENALLTSKMIVSVIDFYDSDDFFEEGKRAWDFFCSYVSDLEEGRMMMLNPSARELFLYYTFYRGRQ